MTEVSDISSKILDSRMPATEFRNYLTAELDAEARHQNRKLAIAAVARRYGISDRRALAIIHGEVGRVWADEMDRARQVFRRFRERQRERFEAEITKLAAEQARLDAQDAQDGLLD